jgi:hypothetical protein
MAMGSSFQHQVMLGPPVSKPNLVPNIFASSSSTTRSPANIRLASNSSVILQRESPTRGLIPPNSTLQSICYESFSDFES